MDVTRITGMRNNGFIVYRENGILKYVEVIDKQPDIIKNSAIDIVGFYFGSKRDLEQIVTEGIIEGEIPEPADFRDVMKRIFEEEFHERLDQMSIQAKQPVAIVHSVVDGVCFPSPDIAVAIAAACTQHKNQVEVISSYLHKELHTYNPNSAVRLFFHCSRMLLMKSRDELIGPVSWGMLEDDDSISDTITAPILGRFGITSNDTNKIRKELSTAAYIDRIATLCEGYNEY